MWTQPFLPPMRRARLLEVGGVGLVAAHLLRGDDEFELGAQVPARDAEQLVVDVRDDSELVALAEAIHCGVGLAKRHPARHAVGQELRPRRLELPAELAGHLDRGPAQNLGVELVGATHDLRLDLEEALDELILVVGEAVALGLLFERLEDALLPIDQGAIAVGGHPRGCL